MFIESWIITFLYVSCDHLHRTWNCICVKASVCVFEYKGETKQKDVQVKKASTKSLERASTKSAQTALRNSVTCQQSEKAFSYAIIPVSILHCPLRSFPMAISGVSIPSCIRLLSVATRADKVYSATRPGNSLTTVIWFSFHIFTQTH